MNHGMGSGPLGFGPIGLGSGYSAMPQYRYAYSNYETRNCKDLQIQRLKTEHTKKGFYYSALKAWNDIPANIREIQTLRRFKKELKRT